MKSSKPFYYAHAAFLALLGLLIFKVYHVHQSIMAIQAQHQQADINMSFTSIITTRNPSGKVASTRSTTTKIENGSLQEPTQTIKGSDKGATVITRIGKDGPLSHKYVLDGTEYSDDPFTQTTTYMIDGVTVPKAIFFKVAKLARQCLTGPSD